MHFSLSFSELFEVATMLVCVYAGERLSDEEVNELLQGHEDSQGNVNYEGLLQRLPFLQCMTLV